MEIPEIILEDGSGSNISANSFIDLPYFYLKSILYLKATDEYDEKTIIKSIYVAHYYLSLYYKWYSVKLIPSQPLFFPRVNNSKYRVLLQTVPENIKMAVVAVTCYILRGVDVLNIDEQLKESIPRTQEVRVDDLAIKYNIDKDIQLLQNTIIRFNDVEELIRHYCYIPTAFEPKRFNRYF